MNAPAESEAEKLAHREARRGRLPVVPGRARPHAHPINLETQFAPETRGGGLNLAAYGRTLMRRRWTFVATVLIALAIGAAVTLLTRPVYTAQSTLQIDREAERVVSREDATPADNMGEEFYQTQYGLLRSRALAERVANHRIAGSSRSVASRAALRRGALRPSAAEIVERGGQRAARAEQSARADQA